MRVLQVLDHVGIYLVIAGTMTPFMLVGFHNHTSARVLICAEWIFAFLGSVFAGIFFSFFFMLFIYLFLLLFFKQPVVCVCVCVCVLYTLSLFRFKLSNHNHDRINIVYSYGGWRFANMGFIYNRIITSSSHFIGAW
jgi:channel protein (hemolysin III family)